MTKWEYLTAPILTHAAKQILDNFGSDGWELVADRAGHEPGEPRRLLQASRWRAERWPIPRSGSPSSA